MSFLRFVFYKHSIKAICRSLKHSLKVSTIKVTENLICFWVCSSLSHSLLWLYYDQSICQGFKCLSYSKDILLGKLHQIPIRWELNENFASVELYTVLHSSELLPALVCFSKKLFSLGGGVKETIIDLCLNPLVRAEAGEGERHDGEMGLDR